MPYMLDERHPEDTLFLVVEEDFRFFDEEGEPIAPEPQLGKSQQWMAKDIPPELREPFASSQESARLSTLQAHWQTRVKYAGATPKSGAKQHTSTEPSFNTRLTKASRTECEQKVSPHMEHLVRLVTAAHRLQVGDLVWFCWDEDVEKEKGSPDPQHAITGIAVSIPGARWIKEEITKTKVWHWDVELKKLLEQGKAKASFIFPSVGHYTKHSSGILKQGATRETFWGAWFVQQGVRPSLVSDRVRELWRWRDAPQGPQRERVSLVSAISLEEHEWPKLAWKTLFRRDPKMREPIASYDAKGNPENQPPPEPLTQEQMRSQFDMDKMVLPTDCAHGTRKQRDYRNQKMVAKLRVFTQSILEAMSNDSTHSVCVQVTLRIENFHQSQQLEAKDPPNFHCIFKFYH